MLIFHSTGCADNIICKQSVVSNKKRMQKWSQLRAFIKKVGLMRYLNVQILRYQWSWSSTVCMNMERLATSRDVIEFCCSMNPTQYPLFSYSQIKLYLVSIISHCLLSPHPSNQFWRERLLEQHNVLNAYITNMAASIESYDEWFTSGNGELVSSVWFNVLNAWLGWFTAQLRNPPWLGVWDTVLDQVTVHFLEQSGNTWMYSSWCFHHSFCFVNLLDVVAQLGHMNIGKHLSQSIRCFCPTGSHECW